MNEKFEVGQRVEVFSFGKWYRGTVLKVNKSRCLVRYTTSGSTRDKFFGGKWGQPLRPLTTEPGVFDFGGTVDKG